MNKREVIENALVKTDTQLTSTRNELVANQKSLDYLTTLISGDIIMTSTGVEVDIKKPSGILSHYLPAFESKRIRFAGKKYYVIQMK